MKWRSPQALLGIAHTFISSYPCLLSSRSSALSLKRIVLTRVCRFR